MRKKIIIPKLVVENSYEPDFIRKLEPQKNKNSCGTCALRAILGLEYGYEISEKNLWEYKRRVSGTGITPGTGPSEIAKIMHRIDKRGLKIGLKVFMTCNGDPEQLRYFLRNVSMPIIHRKFHEGIDEKEKKDGHYEVVLGLDKKDSGEIYLYNSAGGYETSGFYKRSIKEFLDFWWPYAKHGERWYLAAIPKEEKLPSNFRGKYM